MCQSSSANNEEKWFVMGSVKVISVGLSVICDTRLSIPNKFYNHNLIYVK